MLEEVVRRVGVLEAEAVERARTRVAPTPDPNSGFFFWSGSVSSTSSESRTSPDAAGRQSAPDLLDFTEQRAYVELALLLARKVSDVVSSKATYDTDVNLANFVPNAALADLDVVEVGLLRRINQLAAHQTFEGGSLDWPIAEIGDWARDRRQEVTAKLAGTSYGDAFEGALDLIRNEVDGDGWRQSTTNSEED